MKKPIYLDYNGTTPHAPEVIEAMRPFMESEFGNPSSSHAYGVKVKEAVETARGQVARMLNCLPKEIVFTSGGTESNNHALKCAGGARFSEGRHIITSCIEHPAVLEVCRFLETHGFEVTYLPVDGNGLVSLSDVAGAIKPETIFVSIMHANNEVGTVQPVGEIARIARDKGILFHTDAAQSIGKIPVDVDGSRVDLLSVAGHKIYAPKGIGALYVREGVDPGVFCHGAGQERNIRAGTENVMGIVGLGTACEVARRDLPDNRRHMQETRDRLEEGLALALDDIRFNGHREKRLPNTCSVSFLDLEANRILSAVGKDIAASAGAACHSNGIEMSHVLRAMGVPEIWAKGTLRFTTGRMTTVEEIDRSLEVIVSAVKKMRR
ncbi:MAG: cysteine desulfurase family protein [Acidobacteriota bacterium]